jgi:hypothetical protein
MPGIFQLEITMAANSHAYSVQEAANIQLGQLGSQVIYDTAAYIGKWAKILFLDDTVFAVLTDEGGGITGDVTQVTYPQGKEITGRFTAITLTSGKIHATKGN